MNPFQLRETKRKTNFLAPKRMASFSGRPRGCGHLPGHWLRLLRAAPGASGLTRKREGEGWVGLGWVDRGREEGGMDVGIVGWTTDDGRTDGWMGGWVGGWLDDWIAGWLDGWLVDWLVGWFVRSLDGWNGGMV